MGTSTEEVALRLSAKDEASTPVKRLRDEVKGVAADADRATGSTRAWGSALDSLGRGASTVTASLDRMMARGAVGLGALTAGAVGWGLKSASSFELSRTAFGALLGDMQQGSLLFDELQKYNIEAPFNLEALASAEQTLLQFGISGDKTLAVLKGLGDVAALTRNPSENLQRMALALGQISSAGVLRAQDLNQLIEAGFPAYRLLSEITGKTGAQLRKEMESGLTLPADQYVAAVEMMQGQVLSTYAGGAEKAADTLWGIWERFKDQLAIDLAAGIEPALPQLKEQLPALSDALSGLITEVGPQLPELIDAMIELTPAVVDLAQAMADVAAGVAPLVSGTADALGPEGIQALVASYLGWRFVGRPLARGVKSFRGRGGPGVGVAGAAGGATAGAAGAGGTAAAATAGAGGLLARARGLAGGLGRMSPILGIGTGGPEVGERNADGSYTDFTGRKLLPVDNLDRRKGRASDEVADAVGGGIRIDKVEINQPHSDIDVANAMDHLLRRHVRERRERGGG